MDFNPKRLDINKLLAAFGLLPMNMKCFVLMRLSYHMFTGEGITRYMVSRPLSWYLRTVDEILLNSQSAISPVRVPEIGAAAFL